MGRIEFTDKQKKVLEARDHNVLVSAAAGSGKTAVLVERIIRMISEGKEPLDIDRLLVVTFTRAAAAQMRERIGQALSERLLQDPGNVHLQRQETLLHNAQITTIDSFCTYLLRNNFSEIGLDPGYRQMDETESQLLCQEVLQEYLESLYAIAEDADRKASGREALDPEHARTCAERGALPIEDDKPKISGKAFTACVETFCRGTDDRELEGLILRLYHAATSHPDPEAWLARRKEDYRCGSVQELLEAPFVLRVLDDAEAELSYLKSQYAFMLRGCKRPGGPYPYYDFLEAEAEGIFGRKDSTQEQFDTEVGSDSYETAYQRYERVRTAVTAEFARIPTVSAAKYPDIDEEKKELVKGARDNAKKRLQALRDRYFAVEPETVLLMMNRMEGPVSTLLDVAIGFCRAFQEKKRDKNVIDFADLENLALQILLEKQEDGSYAPRRAAESYRAHFAEIMIDEYQDSNEIQELLLSAISGEAQGRYARFMVGDVKQSIYRFRLARPEIFMEKFAAYPVRQEDSVSLGKQQQSAEGDTGSEVPCERIDLDQNFRSRREVLDSVNDVFSRIMRREVGGVEYDEAAKLKPGAGYPGAEKGTYCTELLLVETEGTRAADGAESGEAQVPARTENASQTEGVSVEEGTGESDLDAQELSARQSEALAVAKRIRSMVGSFPVKDEESGGVRAARYGDIVILLRSASSWSEIFREILEKEGIPVYVTSRTGYFAAEEIRLVLQLLHVLDNPRQDIPLYGVMRGFFGGFTENDFVRIRLAARKETFYDALLTYVQEGTDRQQDMPAEAFDEAAEGIHGRKESEIDPADIVLREKCRLFLERIETWRDQASYLGIHELLTGILSETGYEAYISALPAGEQRAANVRLLLLQAKNFEKTEYSGLFRFLQYIGKMTGGGIDQGEANTLDESADIVRIMTIHKSKGLEFPICFVPALSKNYATRMDLNGPLILDADLGLGVEYFDPETRLRAPTLRKEAVASRIARDGLGEELRVLYVAMTRAREKLILSGAVRNADTVLNRLRGQIAGFEAAGDPNAKLPAAVIEGSRCYLDLILDAVLTSPGEELLSVHVTKVRAEDLTQAAQAEQKSLYEKKALLADIEESARRGILADPELGAQLERTFSFRYPFGKLKGLYTKTTVSELKKAAITDDSGAASGTVSSGAGERAQNGIGSVVEGANDLFPEENTAALLPRFIQRLQAEDGADTKNDHAESAEKESGTAEVRSGDRTRIQLTGTQRGMAVHRVFELLDYQRFAGPWSVSAKEYDAWLTGLTDAGTITREEAAAGSGRVMLPFLHSPLAARMARADAAGLLRREQPFVLGIPASDLQEQFPKEETILIQGIIDAFFIEDDEIVIVDYKTDRVEKEEELISRYRVQLQYYARALEQILHRPVREKLIWSTRLARTITLP